VTSSHSRVAQWVRAGFLYNQGRGFDSHLDYKKKFVNLKINIYLCNINYMNMTLDEFGKKVWKHKTNKRLFLEQAYIWKERLILIEEFEDERNGVMTFELNGFDFSAWTPMTKKEYDSVKSQYKEIYHK
jgi:hypothetical protein